MASSNNDQAWTTTAPTYATNVARISSVAAAHLVQMAATLAPITPASLVLDNGAGTGAVTLHVAKNSPETRITAADISSGMLAAIAAHSLPNVTTVRADARSLSNDLPARDFTHVFSTFMLQTITEPQAAVEQMAKTLRPGGVLALGIWARRNGPFEIWERACRAVDSSYELPPPFDDEAAWRTQEELEGALTTAGCGEVQSQEIMAPFAFESAEAFVEFWFGAKNPAAVKCIESFGGDVEKVKAGIVEIVRADYGNGRDIKTWEVLGVGRKGGE